MSDALAKYRAEAPEVFYTRDPITVLGPVELAAIKAAAVSSPKKRARICAHSDPADGLHEMLVALVRTTFIAPHKHPTKCESFLMLEGAMRVIIFDDDGRIARVIRLAAGRPDAAFFYRLSVPRFHTVQPTSDVAVFLETTNGPFVRGESLSAPWCPAEHDMPARRAFAQRLDTEIGPARMAE